MFLLFSRACRHHSTKSAKWGAFDTVCPLSASGRGQLPPLPSPGSADYVEKNNKQLTNVSDVTSVCLLYSQQDYARTTRPIFTKFYGKVECILN